MPEIPSRETLAALKQAVDAVIPSAMIGCSHRLDDGQIQMVYAYPFGIGGLVASIEDVPEALRPLAKGVGYHDGFTATSQKAVEWYLAFAGATQVIAVPVPDRE